MVVAGVVVAFLRFPTLTVRGRELLDRCHNPVVLRGVNKMNVWTDRDGSLSFPQIAKTGANSVRIVWSAEGTAQQLDTVLANAVAHELLPMIEDHDATGDFAALPRVVDYWLRDDVLAVLKSHEHHLLLNIANEAGDEHVTDAAFVAGYTDAIRRLRRAGLRLPLVIDGTNFGRDIDILQRNAPALLREDQNLIFSVHLWWMDEPKERVERELDEARDLPLIVGEFAHTGPGCKGVIDYTAIMAAAEARRIGWYAWEWGPGNLDCPDLDMTANNELRLLRDWAKPVVQALRSARAISCL